MTSSWRHHAVKKIFYMAHARVQTIIFKTCGRSRSHLLYFSQYKRSKSGHFYTKSYHYYILYIIYFNQKPMNWMEGPRDKYSWPSKIMIWKIQDRERSPLWRPTMVIHAIRDGRSRSWIFHIILVTSNVVTNITIWGNASSWNVAILLVVYFSVPHAVTNNYVWFSVYHSSDIYHYP